MLFCGTLRRFLLSTQIEERSFAKSAQDDEDVSAQDDDDVLLQDNNEALAQDDKEDKLVNCDCHSLGS